MSIAIAIAGWLGAAVLLWAYALVSSSKLDGNGARFQLMNMLGGVGLATSSAASGAWASAAVNVVWIAIGIATVGAGMRRRSAHRAPPPPARRAISRLRGLL